MSEVANKVYDILVTHAGASEGMRDDFVYHWRTPEYRFCGFFGLGGKFWYKEFKVSCYSEDLTPGLQVLLDIVNLFLKDTLADEVYRVNKLLGEKKEF